ncbi:unnamed protein product [Acanthosepion pharaonis]|uniref:Uncharacterized protein n=1 Tax=Acanthosepion pharaonis TaxID=158019 RepID=A0A812DZC4_ACAPH|nr:unnamed protein product [Sepia pharaonis]
MQGVRLRQTKAFLRDLRMPLKAGIQGSGYAPSSRRTNRVVEGLVSIDRSVVAALRHDTPSLNSSGLRAIPFVSTLHGVRKSSATAKSFRLSRISNQVADAQTPHSRATTAEVADAHGNDGATDADHDVQPPPSDNDARMAGSSGTKRDAFSVFARRQRRTAARSSEHANRCSDPAVPLVLDGIAVATADVTRVPIELTSGKDQKATSLRTLGRHKPVITVVTFRHLSRNGALRSERIDGPRFRGPYSPKIDGPLSSPLDTWCYCLTDVARPSQTSPARHGPWRRVERGLQSAGARALALVRGLLSDPSPFTGFDDTERRRSRRRPETGTNETPAHRRRRRPRPTEKKTEAGGEEERRRREAKPPTTGRKPKVPDRIRYRQTKLTPTATDGCRPAPDQRAPNADKGVSPAYATPPVSPHRVGLESSSTGSSFPAGSFQARSLGCGFAR